MNDYLGTSHEVIYEMVHEGEPGRSNTWARGISSVSRDLGSQLTSLREQCAHICSVWSDGVGSVRLTADLGAVIDYLQVLADGLSGQSASYADITVQAAADLSAAQPPSALPPPPARSAAELSAEYRQIAGSPADPVVIDVQIAQVAQQIAANQAAWIKAGETATTLDNEYRTALARLTPPPEPPPIVLDAATAGGAVDPPSATGSAAAGGVSVGGSAARTASSIAIAPWSIDRYLPGGPTGGVDGPGRPVPGGSSPSPISPVGAVGTSSSIRTVNPVGTVDSVAAVSAGPAGVTGSGVADWSGGGVISAGLLSGGASAMGSSRPRVDPAGLHGGIWGGSANAGAAGLGTGGAAADQLARGSLASPVVGGTGFDPLTGGAFTSGGGRFATTTGTGGSGWAAAAGLGGIAAVVAGAARAIRGGSGAVTAAGLSGGFATGASAGSASASAGSASASAGSASAVAGSARGVGPATSAAGSSSMGQGGQIGQAGRGISGAAGAGTPRPAAPGSGIGGEHGYRVTWLVEDRDLYGRGPSVKSVIEASPEAE